MNIAVIAADGRTGQAFVAAALGAGHSVRAGVMHPAKHHLPKHPSLAIVRCDATKEDEVRTLLDGQDAVVSFIGHVKGSAADVQTRAVTAVAKAMKAVGMTRIVSLTGTGVRFPGDVVTLLDRILNLAVTVIDPARVRDGQRHVEVLRDSGLQWTVIRVLKLQNTPPHDFILREHGPTKPYVGRREAAQAALEVLEQGTFIQQAPIIGRP